MTAVPQELAPIAARVAWNERVDYTLAHPDFFLQQVMNYGTAEDVAAARRYFPESAFREALSCTPPGRMDVRSWSYWHHIFGVEPIPPLPRRAFRS